MAWATKPRSSATLRMRSLVRASWASVAASTNRIVRRGGRAGVAELVVRRDVRPEGPRQAVDGRLEGGNVLGRRPIGRDRQELERPRDGVIEGGQVVQGCLALGVGHQLEVEWGELEPAAQLTPTRKVSASTAAAGQVVGGASATGDLPEPSPG